MSNIHPTAEKACRNIVRNCGVLLPGERALVISDMHTRSIGRLIEAAALNITSEVIHETLAPLGTHGEEPPDSIAACMHQSDVIFGLTSMSMAHTEARLTATSAGARFLSMPDYSLSMLSRPALHVDFHAISPVAEILGRHLTRAGRLTISSDIGTELSVNIENRTANVCPGWCDGPGTMASPPDAETNVAPIEYSANGTLVVDGSIPFPGLGVLDEPVVLTLQQGRIVSGHGKKFADVMKVLNQDPTGNSCLLAEVGIGLNPEARLCNSMLEDEGAIGTIHFGFGSNHTIGGTIKASQHIDMVITNPTMAADDTLLLQSGVIQVK